MPAVFKQEYSVYGKNMKCKKEKRKSCCFFFSKYGTLKQKGNFYSPQAALAYCTTTTREDQILLQRDSSHIHTGKYTLSINMP